MCEAETRCANDATQIYAEGPAWYPCIMEVCDTCAEKLIRHGADPDNLTPLDDNNDEVPKSEAHEYDLSFASELFGRMFFLGENFTVAHNEVSKRRRKRNTAR